MIANDEQFDVVREQIGRLERALQSLAREVRPKNPRQFEILAQGYVDQLATLRAEVDEYLGIAALKSHAVEDAS
jgi:hypothetical protein